MNLPLFEKTNNTSNLPIPPCPPWGKLAKHIESQVRAALHEFKLLTPELGAKNPPSHSNTPVKIAVALSGGKDSLCLLAMLRAISHRGFPPFKLIALHISGQVNCGAAISQAHCQNFCRSLQIPLYVHQPKERLQDLGCYKCSRIRRSLLFDLAKEHDTQLIAFGHHRDDNAQTFMMNLVHGAKPAGMLPKVPMQKYGISIIRPLIFVSEEDILKFASAYQLLRATCQCPVGAQSHRKKIHEHLLALEQIYPNARKNIAQASLQWGLDDALKP